MKIEVLKPGLLTSIQDLGRYGYQRHGIIVSGAMDVQALRLSNILVGNDEKEAAIEMTMLGPELFLEGGTLFSITGADLSPTIDGLKVPMYRPIYLKKDSLLKFSGSRIGCYAYLAVAGGYAVEKVLGSKSTYLRAEIGGFNGRTLKKGDSIKINSLGGRSQKIIDLLKVKEINEAFSYENWYTPHKVSDKDECIRVIRERQFEQFDEESQKNFFQDKFTISNRSDRMGYRLSGKELKLKRPSEMISEPVTLGTVQIPPDGNPIILLADRQTTGGYPKIAKVIETDIQKVVQKKPGEALKFKEVYLREAEELYIKREEYIINLKRAIDLKVF